MRWGAAMKPWRHWIDTLPLRRDPPRKPAGGHGAAEAPGGPRRPPPPCSCTKRRVAADADLPGRDRQLRRAPATRPSLWRSALARLRPGPSGMPVRLFEVLINRGSVLMDLCRHREALVALRGGRWLFGRTPRTSTPLRRSLPTFARRARGRLAKVRMALEEPRLAGLAAGVRMAGARSRRRSGSAKCQSPGQTIVLHPEQGSGRHHPVLPLRRPPLRQGRDRRARSAAGSENAAPRSPRRRPANHGGRTSPILRPALLADELAPGLQDPRGNHPFRRRLSGIVRRITPRG